jgi:hypothetical protein
MKAYPCFFLFRLVFITLSIFPLVLKSQTFEYAKQFGSMGGEIKGECIAIDNSGNTYITGGFVGEVDFDPSSNILNLISNGSDDIFIAKFDTASNLIWVKQIGGLGEDIGKSIVIDDNGSICLTGSFEDVVDFNPNTGNYNISSTGGTDIFVLKLDRLGNFFWANNMGGLLDDKSEAITFDDQGNIYTTGSFIDSGDFDPGIGVFNLTGAQQEIFVSKLSSNGSFLWAKNMGGGGFDIGRSIAVDTQGNVYTTGEFIDSADFDPGIGIFTLSTGSDYNIFVSKLNNNGNFIWAKEISGTNVNYGRGIAVDNNFNVYLTGHFRGTVDFDPSPNIFNLTPSGTWGSFILKLDIIGSLVWAKMIDGTGWVLAESIAVGSAGDIYTTGTFRGIVDFDPDTSSYIITAMTAVGDPVTYSNAYITRLTNSGSFVWAKQMGGNETRGLSIVINGIDDSFVTGFFAGSGELDFSSGNGTTYLSGSNRNTLFSTRFDKLGTLLLAKEIGGDMGDDLGISVINDAQGNLYTAGYFSGTIDFGPGLGITNLSSAAGSWDIYVCKYDLSGNLVWAKNIGGLNIEIVQSIAMDAAGNLFLTGRFRGTADFDPSSNTFPLVSSGDMDIFVLKLDNSGNFVWAKRMGGTSTDIGFGIDIDNQNNVYITGGFSGTVDFNPNFGIYNLHAEGASDIFICKLDSLGNFVWANKIGSSSSRLELAYSIKHDDNNNIIISGHFADTVDFDPSSNTSYLTSTGREDIFILKLDASGNFVWVKHIGGPSYDFVNSMAIGSNNDIYFTGGFSSLGINPIPIDFDPGPNVYNLTPFTSHFDVYICKLDVQGNFVWAKNVGGTSWDEAYSIALDHYDNVYTTGKFNGNVDFDPSTGTANLIAQGFYDTFILMLDSVGNFQFVQQLGGTELDYGQAISVDYLGSVYTTGSFQLSADFNFGAGTYNLTSVWESDAFLHKIGQPYLNVNKKELNQIGINAKVYPNPTTGIVNIEISDKFSKAKISIINSIGQVLDVHNFHSKMSQIKLPIEKGYYFVKVETEKAINTFKIIKQ